MKQKTKTKSNHGVKLYRDPEWLHQKYWEEGLSLRAIAKKYGYSNPSIYRWMKKLEIERRTMSEALSGNIAELKEWLRELYLEGKLSLKEIAGQFGVCPEAVRKWLKKFDIPRRTNHKHRESFTKLHRAWRDMKSRCYNFRAHHYKWYGAKGIKVCKEWLNNFVAFRDWALAHGYEKNLTIDRIDNSRNYEISNCQWITKSANSKKRWEDSRKKGVKNE